MARGVVATGVTLAAYKQVGEVADILSQLLNDLNAGLLTAITSQAQAEVMDDFLDHGEGYLKAGQKNEAGAVVGVVFEDSIRRACRKRKLPEKNEKLDELISALVGCGVLSTVKAKRARAAAGVRTKATHAQWDEFDNGDVKAAIDFTREFIVAEFER
jgi:hypothetical protein